MSEDNKKELELTQDSLRALIQEVTAKGNAEMAAAFKGIADEVGKAVKGLGEVSKAAASVENDSNKAKGLSEDSKESKSVIPDDYKFESFGENLVAAAHVGKGINHKRFEVLHKAALGQNITIPSEGGQLVEPEYAQEIFRIVSETGLVMQRCNVRTTVKNSLVIPTIDETSRANGSRWGGVQAYWGAEAADFTASKMKYGSRTLTLHKLHGLGIATEEMLEDAGYLGSYLMDAFSEELTFVSEDAIFNGDGSGKPLGILNSPALVTVAKEGSQGAGSIVYDNITKMASRMHARSYAKAAWFVNQDIFPQLMKLSIAVGTGGGPVWLPAGGLSAAPYSTLLGRPVVPVEYCQTLGTVGDIILADMSQYQILRKGGIKTAIGDQVYFISDQTAFKYTMRIDGQPMWSKPLTPKNGTNTVSPFVALATR